MYRRDYILNEARKFAALLAKLLGLKAEGNTDEFQAATAAALRQEFETDLPTLLNLTEEAFTSYIFLSNFTAEKLNALGELLYLQATPLKPDETHRAAAQKILLIFDLLEQQYHYQTFQNIGRRVELEKFLD